MIIMKIPCGYKGLGRYSIIHKSDPSCEHLVDAATELAKGIYWPNIKRASTLDGKIDKRNV